MKLDKSILEPVYFVDEFYAPIFRMLDKSGDEYTVIDKAGSVIVNKKWADVVFELLEIISDSKDENELCDRLEALEQNGL